MKVGLFFGSFNPIHIGHLAIANYMLSFTDLEQIWFVVSPQNPFKKKETLLDEKQRLYMVTIAIEDNYKMKASNIEFKLPKPSFTATTLAYLTEKYPQHSFALIMGSDNLEHFHKWKNYESLINNHNLYVYPRKESISSNFDTHPHVKKVAAPIMEISSTFIREAIKENKDIRYFLPQSVYKYITEMNLYKK